MLSKNAVNQLFLYHLWIHMSLILLIWRNEFWKLLPLKVYCIVYELVYISCKQFLFKLMVCVITKYIVKLTVPAMLIFTCIDKLYDTRIHAW